MSERQAQYLHLMGITRWRECVPKATAAVSPAALEQPELAPDAALAALAEEVATCTRCPLHASRKQTVFGIGPASARLMLIGEAPGEREDQQGEPFVGPAGQLLNAMLRAIDLRREDAYIANILNCRPPRSRDPDAAETEACTGYLWRQLDLVRPQLVVALGRVAAQYLLRTTTPLGRLRGQVHEFGQGAGASARGSATSQPFVATYHPAYLLRSPGKKSRSWEDLKLIRAVLDKSSCIAKGGAGEHSA